MRYTSILALAAGIALTATACDDENRFQSGEAITAPGTVPVYDAVAMEFDDGVSEVVDLLDLGASFDIELDEERFLFESNLRFGPTLTTSGTYEIEGDVLTLSDDPFLDDTTVSTRSFTVHKIGDTLILNAGSVALDVDGNGFNEIGELTIYLEQRG